VFESSIEQLPVSRPASGPSYQYVEMALAGTARLRVERSSAFVTDAALQGHRTSIAELLRETCPLVQPYWVRMKHDSISMTGFDVCLAADTVCPNIQEHKHLLTPLSQSWFFALFF
jgi:hypothetical protein